MDITVSISSKKSLKKSDIYDRKRLMSALKSGGEFAVPVLRAMTPRHRGITAESWRYKVKESGNELSLVVSNMAKTKNKIPVMSLIRYGHGTRNGGYVPPMDFVSPVENEMLRVISDEVEKGLK